MHRLFMLMLLLAASVFHAQGSAVLTNAQGLAQINLSVRGAPYTDMDVLLDGLRLKVPHNAHFNSTLPIPRALLSDSALITGAQNMAGGPAGTIRLQPGLPDYAVQTGIRTGTREHYAGSLVGSTESLSAFVETEKARRIDYDANDLERVSGGFMAQQNINGWRSRVIAAHEIRDFGAQGYYGQPGNRFAEQRTEDTLLAATAMRGETDTPFLRTGVAWRQFDDRYRIPSTGGGYDARSRYATVFAEGRTLEIQHVALNLRGDVEHEQVDGTLKSDDHTRASLTLLPSARFDRFALRSGFQTVVQSDEAADWLPRVKGEWFFSDNTTGYASWSRQTAQPDALLKAEDPMLSQRKYQETEIGLKQYLSSSLFWRVAGFHRRTDDAWDRVKNSSLDLTWDVRELPAMDTVGLEAALDFTPSERLDLNLFYQWLHKDDPEIYAGLYTLDYAEHRLSFQGAWQCTPEWVLTADQTLRLQRDNPERQSNDFGVQASLGLQYHPRFAQNVRLSFRVENIWDTDFQAVPGLKPRPATFHTGITVFW